MKLTVAGAHLDTVDVNSPLTFNVKASHNISLKAVAVGVFYNGSLITANLDTFTTATPSYDKTLSLSLAGIPSGSTITLKASAQDGTGAVSFTDWIAEAAVLAEASGSVGVIPPASAEAASAALVCADRRNWVCTML